MRYHMEFRKVIHKKEHIKKKNVPWISIGTFSAQIQLDSIAQPKLESKAEQKELIRMRTTGKKALITS